MASSFTDVLKDNKKVFLQMVGVMIMAIIIAIYVGNGGVPTINNNGFDNIGNGTGNNISTGRKLPAMKLSNADYKAVISTNYGSFTVDLFEKDTPKTVNNFVELSKENYFDGLTFHRVLKDFVIQGGDPMGNGTGGPGYKFEDEIDASALGLDTKLVKDTPYLKSFYASNVLNQYANRSVKELYEKVDGYKYVTGSGTTPFGPYVLAMANSGPATNGSQFFITTKNSSTEYLNGKHTVFGRVISGFDVVDKIENVSVNANGFPTSKAVINSITISAN